MTDTWVVHSLYSHADLIQTRGIYAGVIGIKNSGTDAIELKNVYLNRRMGGRLATVGAHVLQKVSAVSGGTAVSVIKNDTSSSNLPSQVSVVTHPSSVTLTDIHRATGILGGVMIGDNAVAADGLALGRSRTHGFGWSHFAHYARSNNTVQRVTLREGEGLTFRQQSSTCPHTSYAGLTLVTSGTGATYTAFSTEAFPQSETDDLLTVFNASGSGIVLEAWELPMQDCGYCDTNGSAGHTVSDVQPVPGLRLMHCFDITGGTTLTPVAYDTKSAPLQGVTVMRDPIINLTRGYTAVEKQMRIAEIASSNAIQGQFHSAYALEPLIGFIRGMRVMWHEMDTTATNFPLQMSSWRKVVSTGPNRTGTIIRPGECVAVSFGYQSPNINVLQHLGTTTAGQYQMPTFCYFDFSFEFTRTSGPSGGYVQSQATYLG